jgi:hypothetical protein
MLGYNLVDKLFGKRFTLYRFFDNDIWFRNIASIRLANRDLSSLERDKRPSDNNNFWRTPFSVRIDSTS